MGKPFFEQAHPNFFRVLNGTWRAVVHTALVALYESFFGQRADLSHAVDRERLRSIMLTALQTTAPIDSDGEVEDDRVLRTKDETTKAAELIRRIRDHGWIESFEDPITQREMYRFTLAGKMFSKVFSEFDKPALRMRQRNVRNTLHCLQAYVRDGDPYDLFMAAENARCIVDDLIDDEHAIREMHRQMIAGAAQDAAKGYLDYMKNHFIPDHAVRIRVDNVLHFDREIRRLVLELFEVKSPEVAADLERAARAARPDLASDDPLVKSVCNDILARLDEAQHNAMPKLLRAISDYGERSSFVAVQTSIVAGMSGQQALSKLVSAIARADAVVQDRLLSRLLQDCVPANLGLLDQSVISLRHGTSRNEVEAIQTVPTDTLEEQREAFVRREVELSFGFALNTFKARVAEMVDGALARGMAVAEVRLSDIPVNTYTDVVFLTHAMEAAVSEMGGKKFDCVTTGMRTRSGPVEYDDVVIRRTR